MKKIIFLLLSILLLCSCEKTSQRSYQTRSNKSHTTNSRTTKTHMDYKTENTKHSPSKVRMKKEYGVYTVPLKINGMELDFIFDSGAAEITISSAEAIVMLKQGKLKEEDIIGEAYYKIADGTIAEGTVINLRTVQIANKVLHDVQATVVDNIEAPLLLGQSALERFGKISIDYNNLTIEFQ